MGTRPAEEGRGALRLVLLGCYFRGLTGMYRDKDSQREANGPLAPSKRKERIAAPIKAFGNPL